MRLSLSPSTIKEDVLRPCCLTLWSVPSLTQRLSPSGHGVVSIPNWVRVSHASPEGNRIDFKSSTTKLISHVTDYGTNHMQDHVMYLRVLGHVTDHVTDFESQSLNRQVDFLMP